MGTINEHGVYIYDETDTAATASELLNKQGAALTQKLERVAAEDTRLDARLNGIYAGMFDVWGWGGLVSLGSGSSTINFGHTFDAAPLVVANCPTNPGFTPIYQVADVTATSIALRVYDANNAQVTTGQIRVNLIAWYPRGGLS